MFEVAITTKQSKKAAKTSLLNYGNLFGPSSTPNDKTRNMCTYSMSLMCCRSWLVDSGHSICEDQWNCVLQIHGALNSKMAVILFTSAPVMISGDNYRHYYFFKVYLVINSVSGDEWIYNCEKQSNRISICGRQRTMLMGR